MLQRRVLYSLIVAGIAGWGPPAVAGYVEEMTELLRQGRPADAFVLGQQHLLEGEGEPQFDLPFGIAAIDSGQPSLGVFALERYVQVRPNELRARLELARGYFLLEEYGRARRDFERVLAADPPPAVRDNVERFLDLIRLREGRYRTTTGWFVEAGVGYDSNVNNAPDDPNFSSPVLGPGTLAGDALAEEDGYFDLTAGLTLVHPLRPGLALFGGADGSYKANLEADDFNLGTINLKGGVSLLHGNETFRVTLQGQDYHVGDQRYRELLGLSGDWRHRVDPFTQMLAFASYSSLDYPDNPLRDATQGIAGIGFSKSLPTAGRPQLFGSLYGGRERAEDGSADAQVLVDRDLYGVRLGVQAQLAPKVSGDLTAQWQRSEYQEQDPLFQRQREDELWFAEVGVNWLFQRHWRLRAAVGVSSNDSSISLYDYERTNARLSLRYEF